MRTKHLMTAMVLPALFAACTAEEITTQQEIAKADVSNRPVVGNVTLNLGGAESRGTLGDRSWNTISFAEEDGFGARIIDDYTPISIPAGSALDHAYRNYTINANNYAASNYKYEWVSGTEWHTDALMIEGNYMFYYPYNVENLARTAAKVKLPLAQSVSKEEPRKPIKDLYEGENPAIVGYSFLSATEQEETVSPNLHHIFAYPQFTLVNDYKVYNSKTKEYDAKDLTITKILVSSEHIKENGIINHSGLVNALRDVELGEVKHADGTKWESVSAGTWTSKSNLLKNGKTSDIVTWSIGKNDGTIVVTFEEGLELEAGEEFSFNLVMPAESYDDNNDLTFVVYLADDKMFEGELTLDENKYDNIKFAPSYRYPAEEYNNLNTSNPTVKTTAGDLATITFTKDNTVVSAVDPAALIDDAEEFEAFLNTIKDNSYALEEVETLDDVKDVNQFVLARNAAGVASMKIDAAVVALLNKYLAEGSVTFKSGMVVEDAEDAVVLDKMTFGGNLEIADANVTIKNVTAEKITVTGEDAVVTVDENTTLGTAVVDVKAGELIVKKNTFVSSSTNKVIANVTKNNRNEIVAEGTITFDGETVNKCGPNFAMEGGNVVVAADSKITWGDGTALNGGNIENNGTIEAIHNFTIPAGITIDNKGTLQAVSGKTITNNGTINTEKSIELAANNGTVTTKVSTITVTINGGKGTVDNSELAKVKVGEDANQTVYANFESVSRLNDINYDAVCGVNKIVITGDWEIVEDITLKSDVKTVEFDGGNLSVASGKTFSMGQADIIIAVDTEWTGRDAETSTIVTKYANIQEVEKKTLSDENREAVLTVNEVKLTVDTPEIETAANLPNVDVD